MASPHALRAWVRIRARIRAPKRLLFLTDLDGTLIPLRARPDLAAAGPREKGLLRRLNGAPGVQVGVVSGRSLPALRRAVGVPGLIYIGNHGFELGVPGKTVIVPGAKRSRTTMVRLGRELSGAIRRIPGAFVEQKGYSLSVHWRAVAPEHARRFHRLVTQMLSPWRDLGEIRVTLGKRVIEVRPPVAWHKGSAVEWLMRRYHRKGGEVLYLGDDRTDEDAFLAVNRLGGISVCVGSRAWVSDASWRLEGPAQVLDLMERIAEERCLSRRKR
jgi:trehalose 6-phosphate phosphatase